MLLAGLLLLTGCAAPGSPTASSTGDTAAVAAPKKMVTAIRGNPKSVSNALNSGQGGRIDGGSELSGLVSSGLTVLDQRNQRVPVLAEAVPTVENGLWRLLPDGRMETTWKIRDGTVWHDGTPFSAEDVVFSARVDQDPNLPFVPNRIYRFSERIEAPDGRTVRITWKEPYIRADEAVFNPAFPRHLLADAHAAGDGEAFINLPYWSSGFVGNGPFAVRDFALDSHVTLAAFDRYVLGRPRIDEIVVKFLVDDNAIVANILAGEVDLTLGAGMSLEQAIQVRDRWPAGTMKAITSSWIRMDTQFLNPDPPILLNPQFRKALITAVDRREMADSLVYGISDVAHSSIGPSEPEYRHIEQSIVRYEYDARRASQMLEALGLRPGGDGMLADAAGRPVSVQIMANQDDANAKPQLAVLDYWRRVGITPDAEVVTPQRQRDPAYRSTFRSFSLQAGVGYGADGVNSLLSTEARLPEKNYVGGNYTRYSNPEVDALVNRYFTTIPLAERMQVLGELVNRMTDELIYFPLYWRVTPTLIHNRLSGAGAVGEGSQFANAHLWEVK